MERLAPCHASKRNIRYMYEYILKQKHVLMFVGEGAMRRSGTVMGIGLLLVLVWCSGCEELGTKPDVVTVNVMAAIYVKLVDSHNNEVKMSADGVSVFIEMTKQGEGRLIFDRVVQQGLCQATGSYRMSKGEWINCTALVKDSFMGFSAVAPASALLSWATVNASVSLVDVYHWYPELTITMKQES